MEVLADFGFLGLFVASFLAATILPLSSEVVLALLLHSGISPILLVAVATAGNVMGSLTNYALGYGAMPFIMKRWLRVNDDDMVHAQKRFAKYGTVSLLFAWVPVIGDPLTLVAGALRVKLGWFLLLVSVGKLLRYCVVTYIVLRIYS